MKIGVISDTHIPTRAIELPKILKEVFEDVDLIIHAGDLVTEEVIFSLRELAPVEAVAGNMDPPYFQRILGRKKVLEVKGFRLGLFHGHGTSFETQEKALSLFPGCDCVIYGHSHSPTQEMVGETLFFNPGSPTDKRYEEKYSLGLLRIHKKIEGEIIYFD